MSIEEVLNKIEDPEIRTRALLYRKQANQDTFSARDVANIYGAINWAFRWSSTPEQSLWADFANGKIKTWTEMCLADPELAKLPLLHLTHQYPLTFDEVFKSYHMKHIKIIHVLGIVSLCELLITKDLQGSIALWLCYGVYKFFTM